MKSDFTATAPNPKWVTDITSIRTAEHWSYLCIVQDLYSDIVVGWSMSPRQDRQLVLQAVLMAVWQRPGRTPVILHSDRGCQFTSEEYQQFLAAHHITCSMSVVGSCADNAAVESFLAHQEIVWVTDSSCAMLGAPKGGPEPCVTWNSIKLCWGCRPPGASSTWS